MKFSEWKTITMSKLMELRKKYSNNSKALSDINAIIFKLHYAKVRDLSTILFYLNQASEEVKELLELIPSSEEIKEWFQG